MVFDVNINTLTLIANSLRDQFVSVALKGRSGKLSHEYFAIEAIKKCKHGRAKTTVMVLRSDITSHWIMVSVDTISGLKFNRHLYLDGQLFDELRLIGND
jgi:hypothetical protein